MSVVVTQPFLLFYDRAGEPLENGYIYIGAPGTNPETNPITVYWDASLTTTAAQPIRTLAGYPSRNGSPSNLVVNVESYSILIKEKNGALVYSDLNAVITPEPGPQRIVPAASLDIYVNADTGSNNNSGLSQSSAFATIQKAVDTLCDRYDLPNIVSTIHVLPAATVYSGSILLKSWVGSWDPDPGTVINGEPDNGFTVPRIKIYNDAIVEGSAGLGTFFAVACPTPWCIINNGLISAGANGYAIQADFGSQIYVAGQKTIGHSYGNCGQGVFYSIWNSQIEFLRGSTLSFIAGGGSAMLARTTRGGQILAQAGGSTPTFRFCAANGTTATSYTDCPNFTSAMAYAAGGLIDLSAASYSGVSNAGAGAAELFEVDGSGGIGVVISKHLLKCRSVATNPDITNRRQKLAGAATYYVSYDNGDNANDGLAALNNPDTHRGPWKTPAYALEWIARYIDTGGYAVTINLADGVYSTAPIIANLPFVGGGAVSVVGNTTTPANVDFACTGVGPAISISNGAQLSVSGVRVACTDNNSINVTGQNSKLTLNGHWTSAATAGVGIAAVNDAEIHIATNYTLSADQLYHWLAVDGGRLFFDGGTLTISAGVDVTFFVVSQNMGLVKVASSGAAFSGSLNSGSMGLADALSLITDGGTTLPGTGPITTSNGGIAV